MNKIATKGMKMIVLALHIMGHKVKVQADEDGEGWTIEAKNNTGLPLIGVAVTSAKTRSILGDKYTTVPNYYVHHYETRYSYADGPSEEIVTDYETTNFHEALVEWMLTPKRWEVENIMCYIGQRIDNAQAKGDWP